jgi:hypothetical protein
MPDRAERRPPGRKGGAQNDDAGGNVSDTIVTGASHNLADMALAYASRGWPVFPCQPGRKEPATVNGYLDATTDPAMIRACWGVHPQFNVAFATGYPAADVLDVDVRPDGSGFAALNRLKRAGLLAGVQALVRTRSGGLHLYFTGTDQRCGKLPGHFLDFKSCGGYVLAPPSFVEADDKGPAGFYELIEERDASGTLDWAAVCRLLDPPPPRAARRIVSGDAPQRWAGVLAHLSALKDGDQRWRQLHWAACRAAELIAAGQLGEAEARQALMDASRANGYIPDHGEREALRKIARGLAAAEVDR